MQCFLTFTAHSVGMAEFQLIDLVIDAKHRFAFGGRPDSTPSEVMDARRVLADRRPLDP